ncbi:rhodanese-like domain-containing protein [Terribacillus saccharophilus]|uniref:rhodanese-like domain-containing protein n=1 Tax=Terribacillus saccharophilus TaxID=361277 RepID=UPI003F853315
MEKKRTIKNIGGFCYERNHSCTHLEQKLASGEKNNIVDVREDAEVAEGKIPDAKHIALGQLPDCLNKLDKNEHYFMVCHSGQSV